jgi:hypothetical protein
MVNGYRIPSTISQGFGCPAHALLSFGVASRCQEKETENPVASSQQTKLERNLILIALCFFRNGQLTTDKKPPVLLIASPCLRVPASPRGA